ncbi:MAG: membrane dipeptidase [Deltaproteobacteria bacterium]|nr:membrane dipeptidase [Deltaproteobacteria bacterium]
MKLLTRCLALSVSVFAVAGCDERLAHPGKGSAPVHEVANRCYAVGATDRGRILPKLLSVTEAGDGYAFSYRWPSHATPFFLKPSRLGTYLLYDDGGSYLVSDGGALRRTSSLLSDVLLVDDGFESDAEWELRETGHGRERRRVLRHRRSGRYLTTSGVADDLRAAASVRLFPRSGCAEFPEASLDASGRVVPSRFADGSVFGFVDTHSHLLSNFAFGGGGIFHGAPFHPLGIEHALSDCSLFHGQDGRKDLFGYGFDHQDADPLDLLISFISGQTPEPNHATAGWPDFTDWPSAFDSSTHQVQYYRWLERAYLAGLRLVVQHATTNQIICDLLKGAGVQPTRYACNDMVAVDRILQEAYEMEAYIDAQTGGPGHGWFRIVHSPAEARRVIRSGKLAVVLGIETSNLFDCFLVPSEEHPACTEQDVVTALDRYYALGVRVMFPVHKYDNAFSAGDGQKFFIELGNFVQTGHYSNYTTECDASVPSVFDRGVPAFPALNRPREDFLAPPPNDMSGFGNDPLGTILPFVGALLPSSGGPVPEMCQAAGLTPLGEFLIEEMMRRGMIIEVDHMPRRSYRRAYEILEANDYPAAGTHGLNNHGELYRLGGVSASGFARCRSASASATMDDGHQARIEMIEDAGGFPAEGFGFDLNGFAGAPGPRFGPKSVCGSTPQTDPVTYPFSSYAGDVIFTEPHVGNRTIDFNTEGMAHIGLVAELIEEVRRDGVSDAELEPLFKSAEGYLRMWEKAERRAREIRAEAR